MPSIDVTDRIEIAAPLEAVFDLVSDYGSWHTWNPMYRCELVDADAIAEGVIIKHRYGKGPITLSSFTRRVDEIEPNAMLRESYIDGDLVGSGTWRFEPTAAGTELSYHCAVRSNTLMTHLSLALVGEKGHSSVYQDIFKTLKTMLES